MAQYAEDSSYEEAISQLQNIKAMLEEDVSVLIRAGEDCVDNTDNDPAAESSSGKVRDCAAQINEAIATVEGVIQDLAEELEEIHNAAARAQY